MSYLRWWQGQFHQWIHLQIFICIVLSGGSLHLWLQSHTCLNLDDGRSTPSPDPSPVLFITILFTLYLHRPYILYFSSSNVNSFEWQIWNLLFYVDLEIFSKMKLICVHTQYYWWILFSAVNSISFYFLTHMLHICSWGSNYTFLKVLPSKVFITIWVTKWNQVFWVDISISISIPGSIIVLYLLRVHSISESSHIYVSP